MNAQDLMAQVTERMIAGIEAGASGWKMPWRHQCQVPVNALTKRAYRGGNVLILWFAQADRCFPSSEWATYKAWKGADCQVRRGEHGQQVIYWDFTREKVNADGEKVRVPFAKSFVLFNAAQVDGFDASEERPVATGERHQFFDNIPAEVIPGQPSYWPERDVVRMPPLADFTSLEAYHATLAHELAHWTGHESRLAREFGARFGDAKYAAEELVAELSAAFTCGLLQIDTVGREDHAAYLAHWVQMLRADPQVLWSVASKAQAATDHLVSYSLENSAGNEEEAVA